MVYMLPFVTNDRLPEFVVSSCQSNVQVSFSYMLDDSATVFGLHIDNVTCISTLF